MSKGNPNHKELELKFDAKEIPIGDFLSWAFSFKPDHYLHTGGPDIYYSQGDNVLRHRNNGEGAGELTVKRRTSNRSTTSRQEIDLRFSDSTTVEDVEKFLGATGWAPLFTVTKDCHIFSFSSRQERPGVEVVIYDVWCRYNDGSDTALRRFVEVEISKADSNHPKAMATLGEWKQKITAFLYPLGGDKKPLPESLYEIFSGKKYGLVKD